MKISIDISGMRWHTNNRIPKPNLKYVPDDGEGKANVYSNLSICSFCWRFL